MTQPAKWKQGLFIKMARLYVQNDWLISREAAVLELIEEYCQDAHEQELVLELLHNFRFLTRADYQDCLNRISDHISTELSLPPEKVLLVSPTGDEHADSGQVLVYDLKNTLTHRANWLKLKTCTTFGKAQRHIEAGVHVVLVDEFMGTGRTYIGRIQEMRKHFQNKGVSDFHIHAMLIASTPHGRRRVVEEAGADVFSVHDCGKAIGDLLAPEARERSYAIMEALETRLHPSYESHDLPRLGDGACESLYGREGGNCPNSVLPIFWWPIAANDAPRTTLLRRSFGN